MPEPPPGRSGAPAREVMERCARAAGDLLAGRFGGRQPFEAKGERNPVTATDLEAERRILDILGDEFPGHAILSEESNPTTRSEGWLWVIDPLDGTRNFASGIPFFCVNIALAHGGRVLLGMTYDPLRDELFAAERGRGATCNGRPARASAAASVRDSVIGADLGYMDARGRRMLELLALIYPGMQAFRLTGSSALGLAYAAAGRFDLYLHHSLYPWDAAAGLVLVPEAGGRITDRAGGEASLETQTFIAGGPAVHAEIVARIAGVPWE